MSEDMSKDKPILQKAMEVKRKIASQLMTNPNVTGVGAGYKIIKGKLTEKICVRVYVRKKLPKEQLRPEEILPENIEGIPVDVIEAVYEIHQSIPPIEEHRMHQYPLVGGISIGNSILGGSGTLGVSVFDNISGEDMILSNWHVMCGRVNCSVGEPIIQPGTGGGDSGGTGDIIAQLHRFELTDEVDAAIARLTGDRFLLKEILGLGVVSTVGSPELGMRVRKSGRTTGVTTGTINDVSANVEVDYSSLGLGVRTFRNQIVIEDGDQVSRQGDSGSVWIDDSNRIIGLNFAGSGTRGIANPISSVMETLNINLGVGIIMQNFIAITNNALF